ncbi:MAG TPA: hypothetical protein VIH71_17020 [Solirubrobacteraceae bacterium]
MRSLQLQSALSDYVEAAAVALHAEIVAGAEVPFELEQQGARRGSRGPSLYCYSPLTRQFIDERLPTLERLPAHAEAVRLLAEFDGLDRYLVSSGLDSGGRASTRTRVNAALGALLADVFEQQTDFELNPERLQAALARLEQAALSATSELTLVAVLHGLTITSPELALTRGLTIAQPHALDGLPIGAVAPADADGGHLVVVLATEWQDSRESVGRGCEVLIDLLRALRLFGDGRVTLGALAWSRVGGGAWNPQPLGTGGRPHGMLVVTAEQEDELRAFCSLVSRRAPHSNELAWALRRFELGCDRDSAYEALTDHLLALRVLLEPEGPASGLLSRRLAALCAIPARRTELIERAEEALALERSYIDGSAIEHAGAHTLATDMADHLRALLRDVVCGHLTPDLVPLADELLVEPDPEPAPAAEPAPDVPTAVPALGDQPALADQLALAEEMAPGAASVEQILGDSSQSQEILDIFI